MYNIHIVFKNNKKVTIETSTPAVIDGHFILVQSENQLWCYNVDTVDHIVVINDDFSETPDTTEEIPYMSNKMGIA